MGRAVGGTQEAKATPACPAPGSHRWYRGLIIHPPQQHPHPALPQEAERARPFLWPSLAFSNLAVQAATLLQF